VAFETLLDREGGVLSSVIRHYVASAKPVSSQVIAEEMDLSSATIRNVLMDLEKKGYLTHPHTSAGRVPMDRGYRFYVDRLMHARRLSLREKHLVEQEYQEVKHEVEALIRHTAKILAAMTRLAGLAVTHIPGLVLLDHFKLVNIGPKKVMVILVLGHGLVKEEMVLVDEPVNLKETSKITQLLNSRFAGLSLAEIRETLLKEAESLKKNRLNILEAAIKLIDEALSFNPEQIQMEGAARLAEQPEFRHFGKMERLVRLMERKDPLGSVLGRQWQKPGLTMEIGNEFPDDSLKEFSFVHIPCYYRGEVVGALGVLGPTRMPYDRVAGVVRHLAGYLEETLMGRGE
jgi:heat-inducible transcriptional repressor